MPLSHRNELQTPPAQLQQQFAMAEMTSFLKEMASLAREERELLEAKMRSEHEAARQELRAQLAPLPNLSEASLRALRVKLSQTVTRSSASSRAARCARRSPWSHRDSEVRADRDDAARAALDAEQAGRHETPAGLVHERAALGAEAEGERRGRARRQLLDTIECGERPQRRAGGMKVRLAESRRDSRRRRAGAGSRLVACARRSERSAPRST